VFGALEVPEGEDPKTWKNERLTPEAKAAWDYRRANPDWTFGRFTTKVELMNMSDEEIRRRVLEDEKWDMSAEEIIAEKERLLSVPGMREKVQYEKERTAREETNDRIFWYITAFSVGFVLLLAAWVYYLDNRKRNHDLVVSQSMSADGKDSEGDSR
jgi:hypothetical protein